jgi:hypothetical protein
MTWSQVIWSKYPIQNGLSRNQHHTEVNHTYVHSSRDVSHRTCQWCGRTLPHKRTDKGHNKCPGSMKCYGSESITRCDQLLLTSSHSVRWQNSLWDWNVECPRALELSNIQLNHKLLPQYDPNKLVTSKNHFLVREKNLEEIQESRKEQECSLRDQYLQHIFLCATVSAQKEGDSECKTAPPPGNASPKEK